MASQHWAAAAVPITLQAVLQPQAPQGAVGRSVGQLPTEQAQRARKALQVAMPAQVSLTVLQGAEVVPAV